MKISACVITKNEEQNIGVCLESLKGIVQEMIVVDTGSTDQTTTIAASYGAVIYHYEWQNDFAAAKNYALDQARGEWIIFLDADEYLSNKARQSFELYMKKIDTNKNFDAIGVRMVNIDKDEADKELSSVVTVRIFRNRPNLKYKNAIHEELFNSDKTIHILIAEQNILQVYHTGYSATIIAEKLKRNLKMILHEIATQGEQPQYYRYLCDCYHGLGDYEQAIKYGRLHMKSQLSSFGSESIVYNKVIDSLICSQSDPCEIREEIEQAIQVFPDIPDFYAEYGRYAWGEKEYETALQYFLQALSIYEQQSLHTAEVDSFHVKLQHIYFCMGEIYSLKNQYDEAVAYYAEALMLDKYDGEIFIRMYPLIADNDVATIIDLFDKIYTRNHKDLKFIVGHIVRSLNDQVFNYYSNILAEEFADKDAFVGQYKNPYIQSAQSIVFNSRLVAAMMIAQNNQFLITEADNTLSDSYVAIIRRFYQRGIRLGEEYFKYYIEILKELFLIDTSVMALYLEIADDFSTESVLKVAKLLEETQDYVRALALYKKVYVRLTVAGLFECYEGMGYCAYKLGQYKEAANWFSKVIEKMPDNQKAIQFKTWSEARC